MSGVERKAIKGKGGNQQKKQDQTVLILPFQYSSALS
jgi:hypothetical protein